MNKTNPDFTVDVLSIYLTKEAKDARCKTLNAYNAHRRAKMDNVWIVKSTYDTYLAASLEEMSVYGLGNPNSIGGKMI